MEWGWFLQLAGLRFIQSGGASAPQEEGACAFPAPGSETDGTRLISNEIGDIEVNR